jgi:CelD/BcsL family acetyltransferase involved in cellulose biosynthesis
MTGVKTALEIEKIEDLAALERIKSDWNALVEESQTKTVELSYEWQITYWKHLKKGSRLSVLIVKEADSIVAIAPLKLSYTKKYGIPVRRLEFIAAEESNYQDFIIRNNNGKVLECILSYLKSNRKSWDVLSLRHIPETSITAHFLLNNLDRSLLRRTADSAECIFLKINKNWEEYAKGSTKARKKIEYRIRRLRRYGEFDCFHCSTEEQIRSNLLRFFELHRKRWDTTETPSQFNDDRQREFYLEVTPKLLAKGLVDLFVLRLRETPVALIYSFLFGRNRLIQLIAYDTDYSKGAPLQVAHELLVEQAFADGVEVIDFGHYYPYKELWADCFKNKVSIEIYPKRLFPWCIYALAEITNSLRVNLKRISLLRRFVRYIRRRVRLLGEKHLWDGF